MTTELAVEARDVVKRYGDLVAVNHVNLEVTVGEVHGLLGPNGAGKTTLMRILFGLIHPDHGDLRVFGRSVPKVGVSALRDVGGFIESPRFYPYLSAQRNLELLARLDLEGLSTQRIAEVLAQTGLAGRENDKVREYSFGMQQRLGIAASLLRSPKLLVVDEPSNGLDPAGIRDMRLLIHDLAASGLTILVSSHNMLEVEDLCDHVTIMSRGHVAFHGSMADLSNQAPDPSREITTAADDDAADVLSEVVGVHSVERQSSGIRFRASSDAVERLTIALGQANIGVRSLTALEAPLETLFFLLTESAPAEVAA